MHEAFPTAHALSRRIHSINPSCSMCETVVEGVLHAIFECPHARATWFRSSLGLRSSNHSQDNLRDLLKFLWQNLDESQIANFMILAWNIWKGRCAYLFQKKECNPDAVISASISAWLSQQGLTRRVNKPINDAFGRCQSLAEQRDNIAWLDGSFDEDEKGGAAYLLMSQQRLTRYEFKYFSTATSPFHMEAMALLMAIEGTIAQQIQCCIFLTDSQLLADTFDSTSKLRPLIAADWRSYTLLAQIGMLLKQYPLYSCAYIPREENEQAHRLPNLARLNQLNYKGYTFPLFPFM